MTRTMRAYLAAWWLIWSAVAAAAIGVAFLMWTPTVVALTFLMAAATIWCAAMLWVRELRPRTTRQPGVRGCARIGVWGGASVVAVLSLADLAAALGLLMLVLAAGTSPAVVHWVGRQLLVGRRRRTDRRLRLTLDPAAESLAWGRILADELAEWRDAELCWAWRTSFLALSESPDAAWRDQVARVRQAYLAELERRYPEQVAAWLATCPRPAAGPERYLRT